MVCTSTWHAGGPGSIFGHGGHGRAYIGFTVPNLDIGDSVSLVNRRIMLLSVLSQFGMYD